VILGDSRDETEVWESFLKPSPDTACDRLWVLSLRLISVLVFRFSITSPPAMTTGAILCIRNGSAVWPGLELELLRDAVALPTGPWTRLVVLPLLLLDAPNRP
jgi:hypothetical protein